MPSCKTLILMTIAAFPVLGAASAQAALVGHWTFDGNLADQAHGNSATAIGNASVGTNNGISGGAASFDGSGDAIQIAGDLPTRVGQTLSISFWEYAEGPDNVGYLLASGTDPNGANQFHFRRQTSGTPSIHGYSGLVNDAAGSSGRLTFSTVVAARGQWNHSLIVLDATGTGVTGKWYINGELAIEGTGGTATMADLLITDLFVGNRKSGARDFLGRIDDLQIYDTLLTAAEAASLYANPGSVIPEPASAMLLLAGGVGMMSRRR